MIDIKFIQNIVRDALHKDQKYSDHNIMHPEREWFIGLGIAILILAGGSFWSVQIYLRYSDSAKIIAVGSQTEQTIYREKEIDQALKEFTERKNKHEGLRQKLLNAQQDNVPFENNIFIPLSVGTTSATTVPEPGLETSTTTHSPSSQSAEVLEP